MIELEHSERTAVPVSEMDADIKNKFAEIGRLYVANEMLMRLQEEGGQNFDLHELEFLKLIYEENETTAANEN